MVTSSRWKPTESVAGQHQNCNRNVSVGRAQIQVAFIFGSLARGTQRRGSDVDVLVVGDAPFEAIAEALALAQDRVGREINPTVYPPREFQAKAREGHHFLTSVLAQPKIFLVGGERELARLA